MGFRKTGLQNYKIVKDKSYSTFNGVKIDSSILLVTSNNINKMTKYIPSEVKIFKDIGNILEMFQTCLSS